MSLIDVGSNSRPAFFDLSGDWKADADVRVSVAFGSGQLRLPRDVTVQGLTGHLATQNGPATGPEGEIGPPTLNLDVHFDVGDIQVNLADKKDRKRSSHEIARAIRDELAAIGREFDASVKIAEVPPGPRVNRPVVGSGITRDAPVSATYTTR